MSTKPWLKTSWLAVVYNTISILSRIARDAWYSLVPLFAYANTADSATTVVASVTAVVGSLSIVAAILKYINFGYRLTDHGISIRSGVLNRTVTHIEFERIQNINIKQSFYLKPVKLVSLIIETAGSASEEAALVGISKSTAASLERHLLGTQNSAAPAGETRPQVDDREPAVSEVLIDGISFRDRFVHGLASNTWIFALVALLPLLNGADDLIRSETFQTWLSDSILGFGSNTQFKILVFVLIFVATIILMPLLSAFTSILRLANFKLIKKSSEVTRSAGFFSTEQETIKPAKIQSVVVRSNLINRFFAKETLVFDQVSTAQQTDIAGSGLFAIPSVTTNGSAKIYRTILSDYPNCTSGEKVHPIYIARRCLIPSLTFGLPLLPSYFWLGPAILLAFPFVPAFFLLVSWRSYRVLQYRFDRDFAFFQYGLFTVRKLIVSHHKAQSVSIEQSWSQRRRGLCTLMITTAARTIQIPYIPYDSAAQWRDQVLRSVALAVP